MKRIVLCAAACLLLIACGKPNAAETAEDVREAEKTVPMTVSEAKPEPAPADEPFASENPTLEPEPTEETVAFAGPEQTEEPAELPPVPPEKRFPGHFSETPVLDAEGMRYTGSKVDIRIRICHETDTYAKRIT